MSKNYGINLFSFLSTVDEEEEEEEEKRMM